MPSLFVLQTGGGGLLLETWLVSLLKTL